MEEGGEEGRGGGEVSGGGQAGCEVCSGEADWGQDQQSIGRRQAAATGQLGRPQPASLDRERGIS